MPSPSQLFSCCNKKSLADEKTILLTQPLPSLLEMRRKYRTASMKAGLLLIFFLGLTALFAYLLKKEQDIARNNCLGARSACEETRTTTYYGCLAGFIISVILDIAAGCGVSINLQRFCHTAHADDAVEDQELLPVAAHNYGSAS